MQVTGDAVVVGKEGYETSRGGMLVTTGSSEFKGIVPKAVGIDSAAPLESRSIDG
jgi:hypothetical protein